MDETLAMLDAPTATLWTRCAYDHRIREQVVRTGTRCLPKHVTIPRSTVSTWRRRGSRPVVTIEPLDQDRQQLVDTIAKLDRRVRILAAVVRILLAMLRDSGFTLAGERLHTLDSVARVRAMVEFHVNEHDTKMPHPAFSGQTPDEIFFGTGAKVSEELALAKGNARAARMAANRTISCERCLGQQAPLPQGKNSIVISVVAQLRTRSC